MSLFYNLLLSGDQNITKINTPFTTGRNFWGACDTPDYIIGAPFDRDEVFIYRKSDSQFITGVTTGLGTLNEKFIGCCYNPTDNAVYFAPSFSPQVGRLDLATLAFTLVGTVFANTTIRKFSDCVYRGGTDIYLIPHQNPQFARLRLNNNQIDEFGPVFTTNKKYSSAVTAQDGSIYAAGYNENNWAEITSNNQITTYALPGGFTDVAKTWGSALLSNGLIIGAPYNLREIIIFDTNTGTFATDLKFGIGGGKFIGAASFNDLAYFSANGNPEHVQYNYATQVVEPVIVDGGLDNQYRGAVQSGNSIYYLPFRNNPLIKQDL